MTVELSDAHPPPGGFRHEALFYAGDDDYVGGLAPFIQAAIEADEPTLVVVRPPRATLLKDALGAGADAVTFADMGDVGSNPARIIPAWIDFVERHRGSGRALRGIGEPIDPSRDAHELAECQQHEALLNLAFADGPDFRLVCPYDVVNLDPAVIDRARVDHPFVARDGRAEPSLAYDVDAGRVLDGPPLAAPAAGAVSFPFDRTTSLPVLRRVVMEEAVRAGLGEEQASAVVLASSELAANSLRHADGEGVLTAWCEPGAFVCEVTDIGVIADPLVGRSRPGRTRADGRGLWLVMQLCDLVQVRSGPTGTTVRVRMSRG